MSSSTKVNESVLPTICCYTPVSTSVGSSSKRCLENKSLGKYSSFSEFSAILKGYTVACKRFLAELVSLFWIRCCYNSWATVEGLIMIVVLLWLNDDWFIFDGVVALRFSLRLILIAGEIARKLEQDLLEMLGWRRISSMSGLLAGSASIIMLISCSSWRERLALGENFIVLPSRSFYQRKPFCGRFMDDAISRSDAPRLKMSTFYVRRSFKGSWLLSSSGAI